MKSIKELEKEYRRRTPTSLKCFERAKKNVPLGVNSNFQAYDPYPIFWDHAKGNRYWDVDGNEYIDFNSAFGSTLAGHAHPLLVKVVTEQLSKGTLYTAPTDWTATCAEEIKKRFPVDLVRFANSGTEATMHALRVARAYTEKEKVIKIEGCYHGMHDSLLYSIEPDLDKAGPDNCPNTVPQSKGIPRDVAKSTIVVPFNNADAMRDALERNKGDVAAVIIEPVMMNCTLIPPQDGYLEKVRELTEAYKAVLIFDEVKSGFKVAYGGASEYYHIKPDLITLAKCLGSGFSLAAFGGKKEIMEVIKPGGVAHGGTYSANPLAIRAGITALREVLTRENLVHATKLEDKLADGIRKALKDNDIPGYVNSMGPCGMVMFTEHEIYDYRTTVRYYNGDRLMKFWFGLVNNGIWIAPHTDEHWTVSVLHTEKDIDKALAVIRKIMPDVK
jgi:glutamate-1-semialdehyde 2,1-aminomutase